MRSTPLAKLAVAVLVSSLVLAGCGGASKVAPVETPAAAPADNKKAEKPPLEVPASFANDAAKREFTVKAMSGKYYKEAEPLLAELVVTAPDAKTYTDLGTSRYNLNNYTGAIEAWNKAAELDPKLKALMLNNVGNVLRDSGKRDEAMKSYRQALAVEPTRWTAAINLADMLREDGAMGEAIQVLEAAAVKSPGQPSVTSMLESYKEKK